MSLAWFPGGEDGGVVGICMHCFGSDEWKRLGEEYVWRISAVSGDERAKSIVLLSGRLAVFGLGCFRRPSLVFLPCFGIAPSLAFGHRIL